MALRTLGGNAPAWSANIGLMATHTFCGCWLGRDATKNSFHAFREAHLQSYGRGFHDGDTGSSGHGHVQALVLSHMLRNLLSRG